MRTERKPVELDLIRSSRVAMGRVASDSARLGGRDTRIAAVLMLMFGLGVLGATVALGDGGIVTPETAKANLAAKQSLERQIAAELAAAQAAPGASKNPLRGQGAPVGSRAPMPTGIFSSHGAPFSPEQYTIANVWQGLIDGNSIQVYAGALAKNQAAGIVIILAFPSSGTTTPAPQVVVAPGTPGVLRIVGASGTALQIRSASGSTLSFDVLSRTFSSP